MGMWEPWAEREYHMLPETRNSHMAGELERRRALKVYESQKVEQESVASGPCGVSARWLLVTPEIAAQLLERNTHNRKKKPHKVKRWRSAMRAGRWKVNGDTIRVSCSGVVLDGQHRLQAMVEEQSPQWCLLVENLPDDVFDTIDIGARRTGADALGIQGKKNTKALSAALGVVEKYFTGRMTATDGFDPYEILELDEKYPEVGDSVRLVGNAFKLMQPSLLAGLHYLFSFVDRCGADRFVEDLKVGAGMEKGDAVLLLRERLMKNHMSKSKLPRAEVAALAIKAWNARVENRSVQYLRWRTEGDNPEPFPMIAGF